MYMYSTWLRTRSALQGLRRVHTSNLSLLTPPREEEEEEEEEQQPLRPSVKTSQGGRQSYDLREGKKLMPFNVALPARVRAKLQAR